MDSESIRTWYQQNGPRDKEAPQRWPITWPKCLGRGAPTCSFWPPSSTPSTTSSDSLGLPSLESLTDPELGYEALVSSTLSSDTDWRISFYTVLKIPNSKSQPVLFLNFFLISPCPYFGAQTLIIIAFSFLFALILCNSLEWCGSLL